MFILLNYKVLVVRTDLGMSSGKIAAQCSHATLACYKALNSKNPGVAYFLAKCSLVTDAIAPHQLVRHWERTG
jgi:peptidyl-tRNA hydrolase, PTH2 family